MLSKDEKYIYGIKANSDSIINDLSNEFFPEVENFIISNGGTKTDAKSVFKDTLMDIWEELQFEELKLSMPLGAYFYLSYRNIWRQRNKVFQNKKLTDLKKYSSFIAQAGKGKENKKFIQTNEIENELVDILKPYISSFDSKSRLIYQLKYLYDKTDAEIAKMLKMASKEVVCDKVNECNIKLIEHIKSNSQYSNIAENVNFQNELENVLVKHYKREANIDPDYKGDFEEILDSLFASKISQNIEHDTSFEGSSLKKLLPRIITVAFGLIMLCGGFYFINSRNSITSLADYYYFPYQYEDDNVTISKLGNETAFINDNSVKIKSSPSPKAKKVVKDDNAAKMSISKEQSVEKTTDTKENYIDLLQVPNNNSIGNSKLLLTKASKEYESENYKDAINTLNIVLNKTTNQKVKDDANWYLALCYLKISNKKQAIKLLKLQSEASTHYDIAEELISYLETLS